MFGIYIWRDLCECDMPSDRVAYVLPKCRFISVSVNFEETQYVLISRKVMQKFYMTLKHACIIYFITLLLVIPGSQS